ncbi:hypothetical protein XSR1_100115 [Xenorhabdus szentirmaii DSM 16338]|uniref:Uncharacterized protein n=1 Tax=Xenorhabdus szentirmaii DSM 16338 TaxID=1427518 RepID=W1IRG6_9GAMM|nr:hypothetical protein XSR1_100115 [Xenorhabdus szentirmaii DSM 16338]
MVIKWTDINTSNYIDVLVPSIFWHINYSIKGGHNGSTEWKCWQ